MMLNTVISAQQLAKTLEQSPLLVVDCRTDLNNADKGEQDYLAGHIPGAVYASLEHDLSDLAKDGLGRHPLPDDADFSATLSGWGWKPGLPVVAYDVANGALAAARLWWMLRLTGHTDVAVLDGGFAAWQALGLPVEAGRCERAVTSVTVQLKRNDVVWFDELQARLSKGVLVDARAAPRYRGEVEPLDRIAGHVPGARNRPFSENLQANGYFKPSAQLREEFTALLAGQAPADVIHMCGSGVTACHNLLAMEYAGLAGSRVFAPSWSGWISDPSRPIAAVSKEV